MERTISTILHGPVRHYHISVVGVATGINFCFPAGHALKGLWFLRLLVYYFDPRPATHCASFLFDTFQSRTSNMSCHRRDSIGRHDNDCRCPTPSCRGGMGWDC